MHFIMRLNGREIERVNFSSGTNVSDAIITLKKKHQREIEKAGVEPEFWIESIPSSVNSLRNLSRQPGNQEE